MSDVDRERVPETIPAQSLTAPRDPHEATPGAPGASTLLAIALMAGVVAGLVSWGVGEATIESFTPSGRLAPEVSRSMVKATEERSRRSIQATTYRAMAAYGALGAAMGLALGLAGGLSRRSATMGLMAAGLGLVLGGAAGAGATRGLVPIYFQAMRTSVDHLSSDVATPLIVHGGIWTAAGLAAGLALGLGLGGWRCAVPAAIGGVLGAAVATVLYEIGSPFAFPGASTADPFASDRFARLTAHLGVAVLVALGAAWSARYLSVKRAPKRCRDRPDAQASGGLHPF
jgi:hypothetical protein